MSTALDTTVFTTRQVREAIRRLCPDLPAKYTKIVEESMTDIDPFDPDWAAAHKVPSFLLAVAPSRDERVNVRLNIIGFAAACLTRVAYQAMRTDKSATLSGVEQTKLSIRKKRAKIARQLVDFAFAETAEAEKVECVWPVSAGGVWRLEALSMPKCVRRLELDLGGRAAVTEGVENCLELLGQGGAFRVGNLVVRGLLSEGVCAEEEGGAMMETVGSAGSVEVGQGGASKDSN